MPGDWDRSLNRTVFWSAKYEALEEDEVGMVALQNYVFFQSARDHFWGGMPWKSTEWYDWIIENRPKRYETASDVIDRIRLLDDLFTISRKQKSLPLSKELPLVNIGRLDRISLDDGRHRICIAILAEVPEICVEVSVVHPEASDTRYGRDVFSISSQLLQRLRSMVTRHIPLFS